MNYNQMLKIAMDQSAVDMGCRTSDFNRDGYTLVESKLQEDRKNYYKEEFFCAFTFYGKGIVASVDSKIKGFVDNYLKKYDGYRALSSPEIILLNRELEKHNKCISYIAEYFIPDPDYKVDINNNLKLEFYEGEKLLELYDDKRFHNALCYSITNIRRDVLAVAGYLDGKLAGLAGVSNDAKEMWQLGIDVLPEFRNEKVASTLTKALTDEVINRGKVPFYSTSYSNIASKRNAIKCGYKHAWVEISADDIITTLKLIGEEV